ncbi:metallophosphoesterase family protein [Pseudomonas sp. NEEL19]|uniref:metallophosphoesterase n=1 Tax=Pseudomonas sp. NEEL19 TaxID=2867409 RepID=UPI0023682E4D|nr:metallophosphoesterase [Pseudomonas sp. NEEL19]WDM57714.1 metallophosphoesterase family protein [Pseudomonas sp. NEEL19]
MRIRIYSDLHREFHSFDPPPLDPGVGLVILGGDIDKKGRGVKWANEAFACPVAYVCGNHEFYDGHIDRTLQKMRGAALSHVHVLENETMIINGVRILGTTAWTDFTSSGDLVAACSMAKECMNDFRYIRVDDYRRLRPHDLMGRNHVAKAWLIDQLDQEFEGKTIVVTHHAPASFVAGLKDEGHLNAAYTNEWSALIEKADVWVFGHTHHSVDVELAGCRVISNPKGYPGENTRFDPFFEIEI